MTGIRRVENQLHVISSKQRPRKCTMQGNDGVSYQYLLKGHEDLRQVCGRDIDIYIHTYDASCYQMTECQHYRMNE